MIRTERRYKDRDVHKLLQLIAGEPAHKVARAAGISTGTVQRWRTPYSKGGTLYPQHRTMSLVARADGHRYELVPKQGWYDRG